MADAPAKKQKRVQFGEEDVCNLFQRYTAPQVLAFLREVAQSPDVKIDWNALVENTATGITSARECQILWRHLAYRQPFPEKMEEGDQPLDDDSDLEYELEASPPVSPELATEVANCVKMLAFGSPNESSMPKSSAVEGDMPNGHSSKASSENPDRASLLYSSNTTLTLSVQKQPQAAGPSGEGLDGNGLANNNFPSRRKRKPWSEEEDLELIAAVKRFGKGNWANIVKGEFKGDRTASQLSQRWAIIRKKQGSLNVGGASSQLSEAQLATRRAIDMALKDNLAGGCSTVGNGGAATNNQANLNASNGDVPAASATTSSQLQNTQLTSTTSLKPGLMGMAKPRPALKKAPRKPSISDSIQAAAVAAGARIASPSDAATLFKAAQSKNAVHIIGSSSLIKPSATGNSPLPPNVHFIRTGLTANTATSTAAGTAAHPPGGGEQTKSNIIKPSVPAASVSQLSKTKPTPANAVPSSSANEPQQLEDKPSTEVKLPVSDVKPVVEVKEDVASPPNCLPKAPSTGPDCDPSKQTLDASNSQHAMGKDTTDSECKDKNPADSEKQAMGQGSHGNSRTSIVNGGGVEKTEASNKADKLDPMNL